MAGSVPRAQEEYESPFPECRVTSTMSPVAIVRLDMPRDRAVAWVEDVQQAIEETVDGHLVDLGVTMDEAAYARFTDQINNAVIQYANVGQQTVAVQVLLDEDLGPDDDGISVAVLLNREQLSGIHQRSKAALAQSNGDRHRWEFSCSEAGAQMLVQQLIAACNGADEPLDHVDPQVVDR